jgi:hypothetical protein
VVKPKPIAIAANKSSYIGVTVIGKATKSLYCGYTNNKSCHQKVTNPADKEPNKE